MKDAMYYKDSNPSFEEKKKSNPRDSRQNDTQKKYVHYEQYELLELKYKEMIRKFKLLKTENNELKSILDQIQEHITLYQQTKDNVKTLVEKVQQQYQYLLNKIKEKQALVLSHNGCFEIHPLIENESNTLTNIYKYTTDKDKSFKEENQRLSLWKQVSTINSTNFKEKGNLIKNNFVERCLGVLISDYDNSKMSVDNKEESSLIGHDHSQLKIAMNEEPMPSIFKCLKKCL